MQSLSFETGFLFNTLLVLLSGALVMFMAAGFTMLESGMVRAKSVAVILTKNVALYATSCFVFLVFGYELMYSGVDGGFVGVPGVWNGSDDAALAGNVSAAMASAADWFFQAVFVATAASIVSGTLAERIKLWPFLLFTVALTGVIYPVVGAWKWGGGWLDQLGFLDFAGSSIVHSVGGWAALIGAILLGPRSGRFNADGSANRMPGNALSKVALGTFILWLGWLGFNGGSQLSFSSISDAVTVANIFLNTNAAAVGGVLSALLLCTLTRGRPDLPCVLNGALAGLVAVTAEPATPSAIQATLIGGAAGILMCLATSALERLRIDDVVGAVPVHLVAGIFGTLMVPWTNAEASLTTQLWGVLAIGGFVVSTSLLVWVALRATIGIRLRSQCEAQGSDMAELGIRAYNIG